MALNITNLTINTVTINFSGGEINTVTVTYSAMGPAGSINGTFNWILTPTEQTNTANFVTALTNKLAAVTGLIVSTT